MDGLAPGVRVSADRLIDLCRDPLIAVGTPEDEAHIVATCLSRAEMRGQKSHGILRLPTYLKRVRAGLIHVGTPLRLVQETPSSFTFDAGAGFGQVAATRAMEACIDRARETGVAVASIRNSTHFGVAGLFAELAAGHDMIGVVTSNAAARMAPFGGTRPVLGTNPIAFAIPTTLGFSIVLDMATSVAPLGKIVAAQARGESIPQGWALDAAGQPTTDAGAALKGVLLPMAGPKGYGLAVVLEVLAAVLSGASVGADAGSMYQTWDRPEDLGHFVATFAVESFSEKAAFYGRLDSFVAQLRSAGTADEPVRLPGELEHQREDTALREGITLEAADVAVLLESAAVGRGED